MVKIIDGIIQEKRGCNEGVTKDVVDALLNDKNEQLTDELIAENMVDLMIPGEDSVPLLMSLAIKYLSDCPAALTQLTVSFFPSLFFLHFYDYYYYYYIKNIIVRALH